MLKKEVAVQLMRHLVEHDWHGYSQVSRWGDGEGTCDISIGGKVYKLEQGDRDCSSAVISAYQAAGINCGGATYTGNMRKCMTGTGNFKWHPMSSGFTAQAGDVYLNEADHTAMCLSAVPDMLMQFSISETGGIDGAEGDQTGEESNIRSYYNYPWDGILECVNKESVGSSASVVAKPKVSSKVEMREQTGGDNQRFYIEDAGNGCVRLRNKSLGLYLDIPNGNAKNDSVLQLYKKNSTDAQLWRVVYKVHGLAQYALLEPKLAPRKYVSVEGNGINGKTKVKLWDDLKNSKQKFWTKQADDGAYVFVHTYSLKAITAV